MNVAFEKFLELGDQARHDVFEEVADSLDTQGSYVEKDFWVCLVLEILYHRLPGGSQQLLFKGGTSLAKAFGLTHRFSEDIDLVIDRKYLGFAGVRDPTSPKNSRKQRDKLFTELRSACSRYVNGQLRSALDSALGNFACAVLPDDDDQTLLIKYPSLYGAADEGYVQHHVKLEAGARSALEPATTADITPLIAEKLHGDWSLKITGLRVIQPARTYIEKLLILHGACCGYRDEGRLPKDSDRISRHYYDVAMITGTTVGTEALADRDLLADVREHNQIAFRQAWKKFDEAKPGGIQLIPPERLREVIAKDYQAMAGMIYNEAPEFNWIISQIRTAEDKINR